MKKITEKYLKSLTPRTLDEIATSGDQFDTLKGLEKDLVVAAVLARNTPKEEKETSNFFKTLSNTTTALLVAAYDGAANKVTSIKETVVEIRDNREFEKKLETMKDCRRALAVYKSDLDAGDMTKEKYEEAVEEAEARMKEL